MGDYRTGECKGEMVQRKKSRERECVRNKIEG